MLNWLLVFVPVTIALEFLLPDAHTLIFFSSALAIIPLAGWLGHATDHLARKTGEGVGGLLNATFGNAAELIISFMALRGGLYEIVKASLTGSIIGNVLLVLGASALAGGMKYREQAFNAVGAQSQAAMLTLGAIGLIAPAAFHYLAGPRARVTEHDLSLWISVVLLITYGLHLLFSLRTHRQLFEGAAVKATDEEEKPWTITRSITVLAASTAVLAWMSEILVGSVEPAARALGMTSVFVGVIVVAVIGNAAEHSTAVMMALRNRMELSLGIAIGSSLQIALFVAPVLVIASYAIGPRPMDLVFTPAEVLAVFAAVLVTWQMAADGKSNWLEGAQLVAVYLILALMFYFLPEGVTVPGND
jgi:Ca2+:H+ antiporter